MSAPAAHTASPTEARHVSTEITKSGKVARTLANGFPPEGPAEWFGTRIVFLWPVAGLFRWFGADDVTGERFVPGADKSCAALARR